LTEIKVFISKSTQLMTHHGKLQLKIKTLKVIQQHKSCRRYC